MNRTTGIIEDTLLQFRVPDMQSLQRGDPEAVAILWEDRRILLRLTAMEITYQDEVHRPEVEHLLADIKKTCLECTPCLRKLLFSSSEVPSQEAIECATRAYESMRSFLEEACEYLSPEMLSYYQVKFG